VDTRSASEFPPGARELSALATAPKPGIAAAAADSHGNRYRKRPTGGSDKPEK